MLVFSFCYPLSWCVYLFQVTGMLGISSEAGRFPERGQNCSLMRAFNATIHPPSGCHVQLELRTHRHWFYTQSSWSLSSRGTSQMGINYHGECSWYPEMVLVRSPVNKWGWRDRLWCYSVLILLVGVFVQNQQRNMELISKEYLKSLKGWGKKIWIDNGWKERSKPEKWEKWVVKEGYAQKSERELN